MTTAFWLFLAGFACFIAYLAGINTYRGEVMTYTNNLPRLNFRVISIIDADMVIEAIHPDKKRYFIKKDVFQGNNLEVGTVIRTVHDLKEMKARGVKSTGYPVMVTEPSLN